MDEVVCGWKQNWRDWCVVDGSKPEIDSIDEGKHTGKNNHLFVEKMMWLGERVTKDDERVLQGG